MVFMEDLVPVDDDEARIAAPRRSPSRYRSNATRVIIRMGAPVGVH